MIQARIKKSFPGSKGAPGFTLDVEFQAGAGVTVFFGPSGAGKTMTLDAIAGFVRPDEGRILLDEAILFDGPARVHLAPRQRQCGYVFQSYALFPHMTLRQNLEFAVERRPTIDRHRRVNELIERFRLQDAAGRRPAEVSGGQKQRCSIARALVGAPRILLLDEPGQGLDAPLRAELYDLLRQVREEFQTPVLFVTHDLDECFDIAEHMIVLSGGRVVQSGSPQEVLAQPASMEVARLLGSYNLLNAEILALDPSRNTSRLRTGAAELTGPYLPGHLIGDRVTICARPEAVAARPRGGRLGANQMPVELARVLSRARLVRLEFEGGLAAEITRREAAGYDFSVREWLLEFPPESIGVL